MNQLRYHPVKPNLLLQHFSMLSRRNNGEIVHGGPTPQYCFFKASRQTIQARQFGGRIGGLKRRKATVIPPHRQVGFGRLIEWFRRKRKPPLRIPMYQNIRTHLIHDTDRRQWLVMFYNEGVQEFRRVPYHRRPMEFAKRRALFFYNELKQHGILQNQGRLDYTLSGVRGVFYDAQNQLWIARWKDGGLRRYRAFSSKSLGFYSAYRAAVEHRKRMLLENREFVMQIFRKRQGSRRII